MCRTHWRRRRRLPASCPPASSASGHGGREQDAKLCNSAFAVDLPCQVSEKLPVSPRVDTASQLPDQPTTSTTCCNCTRWDVSLLVPPYIFW